MTNRLHQPRRWRRESSALPAMQLNRFRFPVSMKEYRMVRFASTALVAFVSVAALQAAPLKIGSAAPSFKRTGMRDHPGKTCFAR